MDVTLEELNEKLDFLIDNFTVQKEVFSSKEAAEYLNLSYYTFLDYVKLGLIRHANNGSVKLFRKEWLDDWLESGGSKVGGR